MNEKEEVWEYTSAMCSVCFFVCLRSLSRNEAFSNKFFFFLNPRTRKKQNQIAYVAISLDKKKKQSSSYNDDGDRRGKENKIPWGMKNEYTTLIYEVIFKVWEDDEQFNEIIVFIYGRCYSTCEISLLLSWMLQQYFSAISYYYFIWMFNEDYILFAFQTKEKEKIFCFNWYHIILQISNSILNIEI